MTRDDVLLTAMSVLPVCTGYPLASVTVTRTYTAADMSQCGQLMYILCADWFVQVCLSQL